MSIKNGSFVFRLFNVLVLLTLLFSADGVIPAYAAGIRYAKPAASGAGDCLSWANACTLQTALTGAVSGNEIWIMAGTHKPTTGTDRAATFQLKNGVAVYGGFAGTETARSQRLTTNITILSGDLNGDDNSNIKLDEPTRADNSYHVVTGATSATLDGFTIYGGNDNHVCTYDGAEYYCGHGGGFYNTSSGNQTLTNITFTNNSADFGGGMYNNSGSATLTDVTFTNNSAESFGGGMFIPINSNSGTFTVTFRNVTFNGNSAYMGGGMSCELSSSTLILTNVTFSGNSAGSYGGGMMTKDCTTILNNATFSDNSAVISGGGMYDAHSDVIIHNSIFGGNTAAIYPQIYFSAIIEHHDPSIARIDNSVIQGGCPYVEHSSVKHYAECSNLITTDPKLGVLGNYGGLTQTIPLETGSSAIDATSSNCPATDQRGMPRGTPCDIGAYEHTDPWYGSVSITSDKNVVAVGRPHIGSEVASYGGFSAGALTAYVPMLFKNAYDGGTYDSALYVQNMSSSITANVTIKYYDSTTGILTCTDTDTIKPLASKGYWLPTLSAAECTGGTGSGLPVGWVGSAVVTSSTTANIVANGRPHIGAEVMTYDSFPSGSLTSYLPMLFNGAFGGDYNSAFYIQNVDPSITAAVTIKYYDSLTGALTCTDTATISPNTSTGYWLPTATCLYAASTTPALLPAGWVGGVVVTSSAAPIVSVGRPHVGSQITTYNGFAAGGLSSYVPMLFRKAYGGNYNSALYIQNIGAVDAAITVKYYKSDGTLTCTATDTIAPLSSQGYWLPTLSAAECAGGLPDGWIGGAVVTSTSANIVAIARPHIGDQVTTYNGFSSGSKNSYLPMLFKNMWETYNSAFYVQNTDAANPAAITVRFYNADGKLACVRRDSIPALSTLGYWVPYVICE